LSRLNFQTAWHGRVPACSSPRSSWVSCIVGTMHAPLLTAVSRKRTNADVTLGEVVGIDAERRVVFTEWLRANSEVPRRGRARY